MFVLGTAGHIDHGKSALVQAMTGMDPDRLSEEKERGMTIDLGFAWLKLPSGREIGIVDVPGHERFVRNMLAGAGGIDIAMLVIAANEGIMPQTREHLAILDLLGISKGLVAMTKKDLVDNEWLDLVRMEVEELLKPTTLSGAPIMPVSAITCDGIPELLNTIDSLLVNTPPKKDKGRPRLPIDRVFTIAGAGTIVTGTLIDGVLSVGQEVEVVPTGLKTRIRGLQTHKTGVNTAEPGSRVAANLAGVTTSEVGRGEILARPGSLIPTTLVSARLRMLVDARYALKHNAERNIYVLASEAVAKIRILGQEEIKPGESGWVQFVLDRPLPIVDGDHFIIRSTTETLGGGVILDAHAKRLPRLNPESLNSLKIREKGSPEELLLALLESKRSLEIVDIINQLGLPAEEVEITVGELVNRGGVVQLGTGAHSLFYAKSLWIALADEAKKALLDFHKKYSTRAGSPKGELVNRLKLGKNAQIVLDRLAQDGALVDEGAVIRLPDFKVVLNSSQQTIVNAFLKSLADNPYSPPSDQIPGPDLLALLVEQRKVVKLSDAVVVSSKAYEDMRQQVLDFIKAKGKITLGETRDLFQTSRKYAQALLEYLDAGKITRRVGDDRVKY